MTVRGRRRKSHARYFLITPLGAVGGCSAHSAPAIILFGAYFPEWLVFAILALLFAIATRVAFGATGRAEAIPYPLFTCVAVGVLVAGLIDLVWLGR